MNRIDEIKCIVIKNDSFEDLVKKSQKKVKDNPQKTLDLFTDLGTFHRSWLLSLVDKNYEIPVKYTKKDNYYVILFDSKRKNSTISTMIEKEQVIYLFQLTMIKLKNKKRVKKFLKYFIKF